MYASEQQKAAAVENARRWVNTRPPQEAAYLNELISAESSWRPDVDSGTGATGLTQFIRGTWKDTARFAKKNIPESELPPGITYDTLDDYDALAKRPLASAFMGWANAKRIEATALRTANKNRMKQGLPDATSLMEAFNNDPRQWATVVAAGHKDGASRTAWFIGADGSFDTTEARARYRERYERFQAEADELTKQARTAEGLNQNQQATSLYRQAQRKRNNDSTGHVFGYADRIATTVGGAMGLGPLEYSSDEVNDFISLGRPNDTDQNPAKRGFLDRVETGIGLRVDTDRLAENTNDAISSAAGGILDFVVPSANAAAPDTPAPSAQDTVVAGSDALPSFFDLANEQALANNDESDDLDAELANAARSAGLGQPTLPDETAPTNNRRGRNAANYTAPESSVPNPTVERDPASRRGRRSNVSPLQPSVAPAPATPTPNPHPEVFQAPTPNPQIARGQLEAENLAFQDARDRALWDARAQAINSAVAEQANQQMMQDLALTQLSIQPTIDLGSIDGALGAIAPGGNPFASLGVQEPVSFAGVTQEIDNTIGPSAADLGRVANFANGVNSGAYAADAERQILNDLALSSPVEAALMQNANAAGLNPLQNFDMASTMFEIGEEGRLQAENRKYNAGVNNLLQTADFQRLAPKNPGLMKVLQDYANEQIQIRAADYLNGNR